MVLFCCNSFLNSSLTGYRTLDHTVPGSCKPKHGRDYEDIDDERPEMKAARYNKGGCASVAVQHELLSSLVTRTIESDLLQAVVSELAGEMRGLKCQVLTLLGDVATRPIKPARKDYACKHCCGAPGEEYQLDSELVDK